MTDIWVCGACHSINQQRSARCYKCGAKQADAATGAMSTLRQEQAIANRAAIAYRPATALGLAASVFLLGLVGVAIAGVTLTIGFAGFMNEQLDLLRATGSFDDAAFDAHKSDASRLGLLNLAIVLPALLFFAAWLSRVVSNVPALGGGFPATTPTRAFINTLIPLVNLRTVPGIVQDVLYRLDPKGGGVFMVGIAWLGLVGSWILSFVAGWYIDLRITFDTLNAESLEEAVDALRPVLTAAVVIDIVAGVLIALGALVLILLILRIDLRSRARDAEVRAVAGV